ncbi:hypothetical protein [Shinella zoogloeoides]|uniref:hypothetical protein n=1 Tax=Shinella zoogloeoides TaxID=352475 RepID=UPI0028AD7AA1|nr:hypothetical protein [Shinella zoogloeoides]
MHTSDRIICGVLTLLFVLVVPFLFIGCILNIITIVTGFAEMAGAELLVRLVGLPVPLIGAIMGWFF